MDIKRVERHSVDELMANMRRVSMLTHPDDLPYKDADLQLTEFDTDEIAPAQR